LSPNNILAVINQQFCDPGRNIGTNVDRTSRSDVTAGRYDLDEVTSLGLLHTHVDSAIAA
jgi:hypothetical protein